MSKNSNLSKQMFSWLHPALKAHDSKHGKGVFTKKNILPGTLLAIFGGHIISSKDELKLPKRLRDIAIQIEKNFSIGPLKINELSDSDYVNHSCSPNAVIRGQISLYALNKIKKGDEITFDYGTVLFGNRKKPTYMFTCSCGSKKCRHKITDHDWKILGANIKNIDLPYYINDTRRRN